MKKALVLAGGGAKGAYHIGVLKALKQYPMDFDIVVGTSIGALVGAMVAQHQSDKIITIFEKITVEDVIAGGVSISENIDEIIEKKAEVYRFFKQMVSDGSVDITPLKSLINSCADYELLMKSTIDFGLVTYDISNNQAHMLTKKDFNKDNYASYLLATASCFPAFPVCEIEGNYFVDGGYVDNCPVELALKMGADELVVIDLNHKITHPVFIGRPNINYVRAKEDLGSFLDFERSSIDLRVESGFYDMLQALKKLDGVTLNFVKDTLNEEVIKQYYRKILVYEIALNKGKIRKTLNPFKDQPCTSYLKNYSERSMLSINEYATIALDIVYSIFFGHTNEVMIEEEAMQKCINYYRDHQDEYQNINLDSRFLRVSQVRKLLNDLSQAQLICFIVKLLDEQNISSVQLILMGLFPKEISAALLLRTQLEIVDEKIN